MEITLIKTPNDVQLKTDSGRISMLILITVDHYKLVVLFFIQFSFLSKSTTLLRNSHTYYNYCIEFSKIHCLGTMSPH